MKKNYINPQTSDLTPTMANPVMLSITSPGVIDADAPARGDYHPGLQD